MTFRYQVMTSRRQNMTFRCQIIALRLPIMTFQCQIITFPCCNHDIRRPLPSVERVRTNHEQRATSNMRRAADTYTGCLPPIARCPSQMADRRSPIAGRRRSHGRSESRSLGMQRFGVVFLADLLGIKTLFWHQ